MVWERDQCKSEFKTWRKPQKKFQSGKKPRNWRYKTSSKRFFLVEKGHSGREKVEMKKKKEDLSSKQAG